MPRLFLAVQIPSHVVENVVGIQKHLAVLFYGNGNNISWPRSGNMHITLKFYGDITTSQIQSLVTDLKSKVTVISPFKIEALSLVVFPIFIDPELSGWVLVVKLTCCAYSIILLSIMLRNWS